MIPFLETGPNRKCNEMQWPPSDSFWNKNMKFGVFPNTVTLLNQGNNNSW